MDICPDKLDGVNFLFLVRAWAFPCGMDPFSTAVRAGKGNRKIGGVLQPVFQVLFTPSYFLLNQG